MRLSSIARRASLPGSLYRLIYCSRIVISHGQPDTDTAQDIRAMLTMARRHNKAANVTGALLFTGLGFAQVLEGPREVVERIFERISADRRHTDVMVLSFTPTEQRCFPAWSMGFCSKTSDRSADPLAEILADPTFGAMPPASPRATTGSDVLRLLEKVVQREDEPAAA